MRVLVTGATGFIGSYIAQAIAAKGHEFIGCVRNPALGKRLNGNISYIASDFSHDTTATAWLPRLEKVDVVVNVVGIITESGNNTFQTIHTDTPKALFDACKTAGVKQVIQISALGVSPDSHTPYNLTKMAADNYLLSLGIPAVVLRPSWLYGKRSRSFELLCAFSALPMVPVVGNGNYEVQPIAIEDFANAVAVLVGNPVFNGKVVEAGGPQKLPIKEMHKVFRAWLGKRTTRFLSMPEWFVKRFVKLGDYIFKGPINTASFDMLTRHNTTADTRLWEATSITPHTMAEQLSTQPSSAAERQHASLFFLLPLLRYSLAFVWVATAVITGFFTPKHITLQLFSDAGISGTLAAPLWWGSIVVDFFLGLTLLFNYRLALFGTLQLMLIAAYTVFLSIMTPEWLLHPYGPLIKNIPLLAATLIVMATQGKNNG